MYRNRTYFAKYLDPNFDFSYENMNKYFPEDKMNNTSAIKSIVKVKFSISKLFDEAELNEILTAPHQLMEKRTPVAETIFTFQIPVHENFVFTMRSLLNYMIGRIIFFFTRNR